MSLSRRSPSLDRVRKQYNQLFEVELEPLGLSEAEIDKQEFSELEESLVRVDEALRHPESFGVVRVKMVGDEAVLVSSRGESHVEIGVVPLLLERKKRIGDRLRVLRSQHTVRTIADLIDTLADAKLREQLQNELEAMHQPAPTTEKVRDVRANSAFIAMGMNPSDDSLVDVLEAIKDGAKRCSVKAERIDEEISNEPITDRMLESIERAEFVIVDLSKARHNVYYEAGYAQGLGKTPIYLAKKGTKFPFDVRDYPIIIYPNLKQLKTELGKRLKAVREERQ